MIGLGGKCQLPRIFPGHFTLTERPGAKELPITIQSTLNKKLNGKVIWLINANAIDQLGFMV
jgi:hypothetical protein